MYDLRQFDRSIGKPASAITRADVQRFVDDQLERGRAPATINRRLAALHVFFEYLAIETENDEWPNPVTWKQQKVRQGKPLPRDVSDAKVERLFEAVTQHRDEAMFRLMLDVGLRIGEVARLQVKDLMVASDGSVGRLRVRGKGGQRTLRVATAGDVEHNASLAGATADRSDGQGQEGL
ncbi:MAG: site-specific integrase [Anaerolineae bacterium]